MEHTFQTRRLRHELKYIISEAAYSAIRNRVKAVMQTDVHANANARSYRVTSLYFDDVYRSAYNDKLAGVDRRRKYRIRAYNLDESTLRLEIKYKDGEYVSKVTSPLSPEQYELLLKGDCGKTAASDCGALRELLISDKLTRPRPSVITDYHREAYVNAAGNVRVTFDKNLSTSYDAIDMFNARFSPALNGVILEIKYDNFIPAHICDLFSGFPLHRQTASKFVICADKITEVKKRCVY